MATPIDARLAELTESDLARPLPAALAEARASVRLAARDVAALPEDGLDRPWPWPGAWP